MENRKADLEPPSSRVDSVVAAQGSQLVPVFKQYGEPKRSYRSQRS